MGQVFRRLHELERECVSQHSHTAKALANNGFPDLRKLPPELSLAVLSYLNATDLCLAACVWDTLGNDELLWQRFVNFFTFMFFFIFIFLLFLSINISLLIFMIFFQ